MLYGTFIRRIGKDATWRGICQAQDATSSHLRLRHCSFQSLWRISMISSKSKATPWLLPSSDWWTNRTSQPGNQEIPSYLCQSSPNRLGWMALSPCLHIIIGYILLLVKAPLKSTMVTCSASVYACNFAISTNEYMLQGLGTKALENSTECKVYKASNEITWVKLGGAHDLT